MLLILRAEAADSFWKCFLQVWNRLDKDYAGRRELERIKTDFALNQVYGIEIHEILARICKD